MVTTKWPLLLTDVMMVGRAIRLGRSSTDDQARRLYELFPDNLVMTERTCHLNMGYWAQHGHPLTPAPAS